MSVKHQLDLSSQVTMFPSNGKEQWNQLMNRMKVIHDQKESLQKKLDAYKPVKKEEIIPGWAWKTNWKSCMWTWASGGRPFQMRKTWKRKKQTGAWISSIWAIPFPSGTAL